MNTNSIKVSFWLAPTLFIALAFSLLAPALVKAAEVQQAPTGATQKGTLIANVDIVGVTATENNNIVTGSFVLVGRMGQQNGIVYGVVITNEKGEYVVAEKLGEVTSIRDGETKSVNFTYKIPTFVTGSVRVLVAVETQSGLPLAYQQVLEKKLVGTGTTMSCALSGTATVSCKLSSDATLRVETGASLLGVEETVRGPVSGKSGETINTEIKGTPGPRYVFVFTETGETHILRAFVPGAFAKIGNVVVSEGKEGEILITSYIQSTSATSSTLSYTLKDASGAVCGSGSEKVTGMSSVIKVATACTTGTISIKLLGADGATLDSRSEPFSSKPIKTTSGGTSAIWWAAAVTLAALLVAILLFVYMKRRRVVQQVTMIGVFVLLATCSFGYRAEAATYAIGGPYGYITYVDKEFGQQTELAYDSSGTVTLPDSVSPSSPYLVTITQKVNWTNNVRCIDAGPTFRQCGNSYPDVVTHVSRNGVFAGGVVHANSGVVPITSGSSGSDTISIRHYISGGIGFGCTAPPARLTALNEPDCVSYTDYQSSWVIPINTNPTVQVWFGP